MHRVPTHRPKLEEALGGKPTPAERKVLAHAKAGTVAQLRPDGGRPDKPTAATKIRADLIRFLMLGGDEENPVHPRGVLIQSAFVTGKLNMEACETQLDLQLRACWFDAVPDFNDSHLGGLYLPGCHLPGLTAQRMRLEEDLHLRALPGPNDKPLPFAATGPVDIRGARITGQLSCAGGRFDGAGGTALDGDSLTVRASVFLRHGFHATGSVILRRATITGQLDCIGGRFDGAGRTALNGDALTVGASVFLRDGFHATGSVILRRATITGQLSCDYGRFEGRLDIQSANVGPGFFLRWVDGGGPDGPWRPDAVVPALPEASRFHIDLTEAQVGVLADDAASWAQAQTVRLSGFHYGSIQSEMTLDERMGLFDRASAGERFDPGPYTRHAAILRRSGHRVDADRLLYRRECLLCKAERAEMRARGPYWWPFWVLMWARDGVFRGLIGYGYRPAFAVIASVLIISFSTLFFADVYRVGQFAPNSDVILNSTHWLAAVAQSDAWKADGYNVPPQMIWTGQGGLRPPMPPSVDYETFHPFLYAVDLFLPLDTIGQTEAWAPSKDRGWWGKVGYYARMPIQLMGWIITALVAALLTGLIGKREE